MLKIYLQYSIFILLGISILFLSIFVIEKGIEEVDNMIIPCQHGTSFIQGKCLPYHFYPLKTLARHHPKALCTGFIFISERREQ